MRKCALSFSKIKGHVVLNDDTYSTIDLASFIYGNILVWLPIVVAMNFHWRKSSKQQQSLLTRSAQIVKPLTRKVHQPLQQYVHLAG